MAIQKNIGKNTIGDNNKMSVSLHDYNMSTHDLSTITRTTASPGTLIPTLKLLVQKGDIIDIDIESNVLTHPTTGPLFGSFKLENHLYFGAFRLYNSWLHNNRTKIGLSMSQIKLPQLDVTVNNTTDVPSEENQWTQINPSCLLSYLGIKGYGNTKGITGTRSVSKQAVPILMYYDIFKNYYANTQEEDFYIIGAKQGIERIANQELGWEATGGTVNEMILTNNNITISPAFQSNQVQVTIFDYSTQRTRSGTIYELGIEGTYTVNSQEAIWNPTVDASTGWLLMSMQATVAETALENYPLENIETMRELILAIPGNTTLNIASGPEPYSNFAERLTGGKLNTTVAQYGLCLKTYNSDLFQNWINTEWVEGVNGVNEISSVDVSDGKLSMDALNLSQKVYNMLNRIVVSGGTYRDWLETVYTGANYFERCETPIFEGGTSQEIVFQEVVSNSASGTEPLGTLAGRGITTGKQRGGHIKIKVTEPGYIMCISSITPRIDYSQGNDWDMYLETMDDLHKPALDGIGYQDSLNGERAWWADYYIQDNAAIQKTAAGKTVAWINYMTNVNKVYGNFASGMSEEFMVLNRNYSLVSPGGNSIQIEDLTTYIDPVKYNYIFADKSLDAMNFWLQIKFDIRARRLISAKQIPNL